MKLEKDNYTKEEVEELVKDLNTVLATSNQAIDELKAEKKSNAIKLELTKCGLDESLLDLVDAETIEQAQEKINKLVEMSKKQKLDNSFKPEDKKKQSDEYTHAEKQGNVEGMLKSKLSTIFNWLRRKNIYD